MCEWDPDWFYVYCTRKRGALPCWFGRAHKTRPAAVRAWNKLMNAARKEKARG